MYYKIEENYIQDAIRIRKTYFEVLDKITQQQSKIDIYRKEVENYLEQLKNIEELDKHSMELHTLEVGIKIKKVEDLINPYYEQIKNLENEADKLYETIMSIYPDVDIDDVKKQIIERF